MHKLFLDIETLPAEEEKHAILKKLFEKKRAKGFKKEGEEKEKFEDFVAATNLDGSFGRILCIGYALDDEPAENFCNVNDEKKTLQQFWNLVDEISIAPRNVQYPDYGVLFVGHNVMDFDLRFIYQRSVVLGVKPPYELNFARYRNYPIFDTMREWSKWSMGNIGLEKLALALGIPSPKDEGIDGSQVAEFFAQGKVDDILRYCARDVETTRDVYKRMVFESDTKNTLF